MVLPFNPPLINSASRWASTEEELRELYASPYTGAVTIRTSLLEGFAHDDAVHQHTFFSPPSTVSSTTPTISTSTSSLNTLGYSPTPLTTYIDLINSIDASTPPDQCKPVIFSVTGSAAEIVACRALLAAQRRPSSSGKHPVYMEINLSCPNIAGKPPPAYDAEELATYLLALKVSGSEDGSEGGEGKAEVRVGIKTPPYTHAGQFSALRDALRASCEPDGKCPLAFITATNTLGSSLVLEERMAGAPGKGPATVWEPSIASVNGMGIGGLAGAALHPLALGNVKLIRTMLDEVEELREVDIIGVGGVADREGFERMRGVGAVVVGVATALGAKGVGVFKEILEGQVVDGL